MVEVHHLEVEEVEHLTQVVGEEEALHQVEEGVEVLLWLILSASERRGWTIFYHRRT